MNERDYQREYSVQNTADYQPRQGFLQHPAVLAVLVAAIAGLLYMAYQSSSGDEVAADEQDSIESSATDDQQDQSAADDTADDGAASTADATDDDAAGDEEPLVAVTGGPSASIPAPDGPYVSARLNIDAAPGEGLFLLSGRVPNQQIADQVRQAAELSYAPFVESELEVDESLPAAEWLAAAPRVIGLLPSVTDGTIMVADGKMLLSARSPNPRYLETLQGALGLLGGGMPLEMVDTVITDLEPPLFAVAAADNAITLSGFVPSEETAALLAGAAALAYGEENVVNELTVEPGTYRSFWMQTMPGVLQLLRVFPSYNFVVEDGQFSGAIQGGVYFAADSSEITDTAAQALNIGVSILARDISIGMLITGHTDSQGPDEYNQVLSQARAQSVVDYFIAGGIDPARLLAQGAGETQPIADNATEEGRAINRRVEFQFGSAASLQQ